MADEDIIIENEGDENANAEETNIKDREDALQDKIKELQEKIKKCQQEKEEYLSGWQRAKADLINARKDDDRRNQEFLKYANQVLICEILAVLDSFDLAYSKDEDSKLLKGFFMIKLQLEDILKKYGLEVIKSVGKKIDLQLHEVIGEVENKDKKDIIVEELQKGYLLNGKVIRPAKVKIAK